MNTPEQQSKREKRISFAGFVCWVRPQPAAQSSTQKFISISGAVKQALEQEYPATEEAAGKWKAVRVAEPGRHFLGFARRPRY